MYILADIKNKIVENQDLYRNKDDFCFLYICEIYILADVK